MRIRKFNASNPSAVHQLETSDGVMPVNHICDLFQSRDKFVIPDRHHSHVTFANSQGICVGSLGRYNSSPTSRLGLHVGHLLVSHVSVSVIEVCFGRGVLDPVFRLDLADLAGAENMRVLLDAWQSHRFPP